MSIVAIFDKDYTDADLDSAQAGLMKLRFDRTFLMTSLPPKLSVALAPDAHHKRIQEVATFLEGVEHVNGVRISYPSGIRIARERPQPGGRGHCVQCSGSCAGPSRICCWEC